MKKLFFVLMLLNFGLLMSQNSQADDIQTPELSPFSMGQGSIQGAIAHSVKEVTGKVNFSVPIANIGSRGVSYPVALVYNGDNVFEQAQYMNKFSTQSTLGVGWSLSHPKIVADHKGTTSRDDDEFYLLDGTNNTRLINTKKQVIQAPGTGDSYMDFELEKYAPYKVRYKIRNADFINSVYTTTVYDYWEITDDKGITYIYGNTDNTRENVIAWGNWIGDSKNTSGANFHTTTWNLSKIEDQWTNNLIFTYDEVNQKTNSSSSVTHTEASYLKQITSSAGGKIVFNYGSKSTSEYYEPHKEQSEPDAYQEQFETDYLDDILIYDRFNQLVFTYELGYSVINKSSSSDKNRYLQSVTQKDSEGNGLPPQEFEYYTSGTYEGGLKEVIYPLGGSVTYNYDEKTIFNSTSPPTETIGTQSQGYVQQGGFNGDDYVVTVSSDDVINSSSFANFTFKVNSRYWVGQKWVQSEFIIPEQIRANDDLIDNIRFVSGKDFYAFLTFDRNADTGSLYLFHKENDGITWKLTQYRNFSLHNNNNNNREFPYKDPTLMAGEDFVAVGENESTYGRLRTYVWNGTSWNSQTINQGVGTYYYGAANNFIISLDENGNGTDMVTNATHPDYYYIHYLDAEKKWQTKSWSSTIDNTYTFVAATNDPSYLYPSNNMVGFMADNNPEYIIRWDDNYSIVAVDNVLGSYNDEYPLLPMGSNNFSIYKPEQNITYAGTLSYHKKSAAFNGSSWAVNTFTDNYGQGSGLNSILTYRYVNNSDGHWWYRYNPNSHSWSSTQLPSNNSNNTDLTGFGVNNDFMLAGQYPYYVSNNGIYYSFTSGQIYNGLSYNNVFNNGSEMFIEYRGSGDPSSTEYYHTFLLSVNKKNNSLNVQSVSNGNVNSYTVILYLNLRSKFLGGALPLISKNILSTRAGRKRIIDGQVNKVVKDIVVSSIEINNGAGEVRKIFYTYNLNHTLPDDKTTFYGEVIVENKGTGSGNIGKAKKYFNTGEDDVQMAGLPTLVKIEDKNGVQVSETETVWKKFTKNFINSSYKTVGVGYYVRPETTVEKLIFGTDEVITETDYYYNSMGLLSSTSKVNSNGETESTNIQYAYQNYSFVNDKNMLAFPYETRASIGSDYISIEQSIWKQEIGKVYVYQNKSGSDYNTLRLNNEITKVDAYGNILESNNGQGIYKTVLYGYGNLYPVATITNATYAETVAQLDVTYSQLQNLSGTLETELVKLPTRLPKSMVNINLYDDQGRVVRSLDERREAVNFLYDSFGRLEYTTDSNNKVIERKEYNYGGN